MKLPTLFKFTSKGQIQQWTIIAEGNGFYTIEGIQGGKLTTSSPTICLGKNFGKSNETSPEEQAILEAKARWQKKVDTGYNEILTDEKKYFEPMLAHEYSKSNLAFTVPTFIQPKLDGIRCYLDNRKLTSRSGKSILSCPHLELNYHGLDGELYNHELKADFNKISSLTRKTKPTTEDLIESEKLVEYWIYDYPYHADKVFSERYSRLKEDFKNFPKYFKLVPTYQIHNEDELKEYHAQFIGEGYEGSIIRLDLGKYENRRSKQLLKYKDFQDDEFEILDITPGLGNRSECAGRLICKIGKNTFGCSMTGTVEFMKRVLQDKDQIIGKQATVKFFMLTPDGIPRFPTLKHIHDYE